MVVTLVTANIDCRNLLSVNKEGQEWVAHTKIRGKGIDHGYRLSEKNENTYFCYDLFLTFINKIEKGKVWEADRYRNGCI